MSEVSALTALALWWSQPQKFVLQPQSSCAEPCALSHALQGLPVLPAECQGPSHSQVPPKGPAWAETHTYLFTLMPLFPKKQELRLAQVWGRLFQLCVAGEGGALSAYRRSLLWCSEQCVGQAKAQLDCKCAHGSSTKFWSSANTSRKTKDGDKSLWFWFRWQSASLGGLKPQHWMLSRPAR